MLIFYQAALIICTVFLVSTGPALAAAYRRGNKRRIYMLHLLRLGLILSACSYLFGIYGPPHPGHVSTLSVLFCLVGTALIWLSFREHWKAQREHPALSSPACAEEPEGGPATPTGAGLSSLPLLTLSAQQALQFAQEEACRRWMTGVEAEQLLLGLLRTPQSAGVCILERLGVDREKIHLDLMSHAALSVRSQEHSFALSPVSFAPTERAQQVLKLVGQEAHRFERAAIGTEHLLLGLVLIGKGKAASVLFEEGVTVDAIRSEIIKAKHPAYPEN